MPYSHGSGLTSAGEYMISGKPFLTGATLSNSEIKIEFPDITKEIMLIKRDTAGLIRLHFASKATGSVYSGSHYLELVNKGDSVSINARAKDCWVSNPNTGSCSFTLFASLTDIDRHSTDYNLALINSGSGVY